MDNRKGRKAQQVLEGELGGKGNYNLWFCWTFNLQCTPMHTSVKVLNRQMETNFPIAEERSGGGFAAQKCYVK